jgi:predicted dehydrogenase
MVSEKAGNVVVMAGNNKKKTEYIKKAIDAGFNVLADKPMVIEPKNFDMLKTA